MLVGEANHLVGVFNLCVPNIRMHRKVRFIKVYGLNRDVRVVVETLVDNLYKGVIRGAE